MEKVTWKERQEERAGEEKGAGAGEGPSEGRGGAGAGAGAGDGDGDGEGREKRTRRRRRAAWKLFCALLAAHLAADTGLSGAWKLVTRAYCCSPPIQGVRYQRFKEPEGIFFPIPKTTFRVFFL